MAMQAHEVTRDGWLTAGDEQLPETRHQPPETRSSTQLKCGDSGLGQWLSKCIFGDRKRRKKQHVDDQSDFSGSLKILDGIEDQVREGKFTSSDSKIALREKLREVQLDINTLDHRRLQLEVS
ncbi:hypothetical protein Q3G72_000431 [Acer saccharum]|nr:hypothetical protein Q3G72_000431 [Acer saccharum]